MLSRETGFMACRPGVMPRAVVVGLALVVPVAARPAGAQTPAQPGPTAGLELEVANSAIRRSNGLFTAAADTINIGADFGLDAVFGDHRAHGPTAALGRLARVWLVNLPIAALAEGVAHDYGHFARLDEVGIDTRRRIITQWPWPVPITTSVEDFGAFDRLAPAAQLDILGAGEQASRTLKQSLTDKIYSGDRADYFDWVLLGYAALDFAAYGFSDLSASHVGSLRQFFADGPGDFRQYVATLAALDPAGFSLQTLQTHADRLRRDCWLSLVDYALVAAVSRVATYVVTGERRTAPPTLTIGRLRMVPGVHASLTAFGPARGLDIRLVTSPYLYHFGADVITTPANGHLLATAFELRSRDLPRLLPEVRLNLWQRPTPGAGVRLEAGVRRAIPRAGGRLEGSVHVGYKTEGYLADAPRRAGLLFSASAAIRY
jgi:hypothetical protein